MTGRKIQQKKKGKREKINKKITRNKTAWNQRAKKKKKKKKMKKKKRQNDKKGLEGEWTN